MYLYCKSDDFPLPPCNMIWLQQRHNALWFHRYMCNCSTGTRVWFHMYTCMVRHAHVMIPLMYYNNKMSWGEQLVYCFIASFRIESYFTCILVSNKTRASHYRAQARVKYAVLSLAMNYYMSKQWYFKIIHMSIPDYSWCNKI